MNWQGKSEARSTPIDSNEHETATLDVALGVMVAVVAGAAMWFALYVSL